MCQGIVTAANVFGISAFSDKIALKISSSPMIRHRRWPRSVTARALISRSHFAALRGALEAAARAVSWPRRAPPARSPLRARARASANRASSRSGSARRAACSSVMAIGEIAVLQRQQAEIRRDDRVAGLGRGAHRRALAAAPSRSPRPKQAARQAEAGVRRRHAGLAGRHVDAARRDRTGRDRSRRIQGAGAPADSADRPGESTARVRIISSPVHLAGGDRAPSATRSRCGPSDRARRAGPGRAGRRST